MELRFPFKYPAYIPLYNLVVDFLVMSLFVIYITPLGKKAFLKALMDY